MWANFLPWYDLNDSIHGKFYSLQNVIFVGKRISLLYIKHFKTHDIFGRIMMDMLYIYKWLLQQSVCRHIRHSQHRQRCPEESSVKRGFSLETIYLQSLVYFSRSRVSVASTAVESSYIEGSGKQEKQFLMGLLLGSGSTCPLPLWQPVSPFGRHY